ncbi:hypothetical protein [Hoylesella buccalis]|nr:hypothetical protein [Hoylesella buccalis]
MSLHGREQPFLHAHCASDNNKRGFKNAAWSVKKEAPETKFREPRV